MAVGAYAAYNLAVRVPDLNLLVVFLLAGVFATLVGVLFGIPSLRIKGFYLAVATLAAQFFVDWLFARVKWFTNDSSSGIVSAPPLEIFGYAHRDAGAEVPARAGDRVRLRAGRAQPHARRDRPLVDGHARHGRRRRGDRHPPDARQALGLRGELVLRGRGGRAVGLRLPGLVGAARLRREPLVPAALHGDHRRAGSILGSFLGAAFIVILPLVLNQLPTWLGIPLSTAMISHIEFMVFGALIVFFLIVEPRGLARLWAIGKEKLRLWPFPH
jgi:branched-chain amino acid transport system permease protein